MTMRKIKSRKKINLTIHTKANEIYNIYVDLPIDMDNGLTNEDKEMIDYWLGQHVSNVKSYDVKYA